MFKRTSTVILTIPDNIEVTDNLDEKNPALIRRLRILADKPEKFEMKKKYSFVVRVKGQTPKGRTIENVDLIMLRHGRARTVLAAS